MYENTFVIGKMQNCMHMHTHTQLSLMRTQFYATDKVLKLLRFLSSLANGKFSLLKDTNRLQSQFNINK